MGHLKSTVFGPHENPIGFRFAFFVPEYSHLKNGTKILDFRVFGPLLENQIFFGHAVFTKRCPVLLSKCLQNQKKSNKGFGSNEKTRNFSPNSKTARTRFSIPIFG
jgi:hypothetical protein